MNLAELAEQKIQKFGEYVTLIFEDREYTNVQMHQRSKRLAGGLKRLGIRPGDRVMVLMPNCPEVLYVEYTLTLHKFSKFLSFNLSCLFQ